MQELRQIYPVEGNTVLVRLPENYSAKQVEVIVLLPDALESKQTSAFQPNNEVSGGTWQQRRTTSPPPLPVWTEEERQAMLELSNHPTTMTDEDVAAWERDIYLMRSLPSTGWHND
ncbi:MAG: hypothetical protein MUF71_00835 [Candidatus Kapabacteria bacterium]|jgi:hypothetical protein|nr:hypothetical protein [Candidatus Kapabacteria bacterium]